MLKNKKICILIDFRFLILYCIEWIFSSLVWYKSRVKYNNIEKYATPTISEYLALITINKTGSVFEWNFIIIAFKSSGLLALGTPI